MHHFVLDLLFILIVGGATFAISKRSMAEACMVWFVFIMASLIALNSFEAVAQFIVDTMFAATDEWLYCYMWLLSLLVIFSGSATLILIGFAKLQDGIVLADVSPLGGKVESVGRWAFSLMAAYTLAAFLLTSVHAIPANRDVWGLFPPELHERKGPVLALGPDYQLLTFTELVSIPRSPLSGAPWKLDGPLAGTRLESNRWSSFPIRYALWREGLEIKNDDGAVSAEFDGENDPDAYDPDAYDPDLYDYDGSVEAEDNEASADEADSGNETDDDADDEVVVV